MYGFRLDDDHFAQLINNRTVIPGFIMVELQDPPTISCYSNNSECKAFAHTGKVKDISVCCQEGDIQKPAQCFNIFHRVFCFGGEFFYR